MPDTDLLTRLREAAEHRVLKYRGTAVTETSFTPEQVARGLERMRRVWDSKSNQQWWHMSQEGRWAAMLDAFIAGATAEGGKDG